MKLIVWLSVAIIVLPTNIYGQIFPVPEFPYTLVNDYSNILTIDEFDALEIKFETLFEETSIRIMVIIVDDLKGMVITDYSAGITDQWEVSLKTTSKLILIMIRHESKGSNTEVLVTAGNDMKELITDQVARTIVANEIEPEFKRENYYSGIFRAADVIESLAKKEISPDEYMNINKGSFGMTLKKYALNIALVLLILFLTGRIMMKYRRKTGVRSPKSEE